MQRFRFIRRSARVAAVLAVAFAALTASAAQADDPLAELRAHGTAVVDGVQSPGEWDGAASRDFAVVVPGGGTTPATLYSMNDGAHLYLAVKLGRPDLFGALNFAFDNNNNGSSFEEGDDVLILSSYGFSDMFVTRNPPCPPTYTCIGINDTEVGGTFDGAGRIGTTATYGFYELSHPLDTSDDGHDFNLRFGKRVGFRLMVLRCGSTCASTNPPPTGTIRITSASTVAPETQITAGPRNGSFTRKESVEVKFTGTDDAIAAEELAFECNQNGGSFEPCDGPFDYTLDSEGPQSFGVRAVDEVGNRDATPAVRHWTFDATAPEKLSIRGPRRFKRARVVFRLSATDNVDTPRQLRFRCSLDRRAYRRCPARLALRGLRPGRHLLRVRVIDRTGNVSNRAGIAFLRVRSR